MYTVNETGFTGTNSNFYLNGNNAYLDIELTDLAGAGFLYNGANYAIQVEIRGWNGDWVGSAETYPKGNNSGRLRLRSSIDTGYRKSNYPDAGVGPTWIICVRDIHSGKTGMQMGTPVFLWGASKENMLTF